jgi:hypothetical protein
MAAKAGCASRVWEGGNEEDTGKTGITMGMKPEKWQRLADCQVNVATAQ